MPKMTTAAAQKISSQPAQAFNFLTIAQLNQIPLPPYIIKNLFWQRTLIEVVGPANSGKSTVAIELGLRVTVGENWQGLRVKKGQVIYVAGEGASGINKRIKAWMRERGIEIGEDDFLCLPQPVNLADPEEVQSFIDAVVAMIIETDRRPSLIIFDTLARCMVGVDENSNSAMGEIVAACAHVIDEIGCAVMLVHHTGKDKARGGRGAYAVYGALDTEIKVDARGDFTDVSVGKQRDAAKIATIRFRRKVVTLGSDEDGDPITSIVLEGGEAIAPKREGSNDNLPPVQQRIVDIVLGAGADGILWEDVRADPKIREFGAKRSSKPAEARTALLNKGLIIESGGRLIAA